MRGVIPGNGKTNIQITFRPTSYEPASAVVYLKINSYGFDPMEIRIIANTPSYFMQDQEAILQMDEKAE